MRSLRTTAGFTLIELIVTMTIVAILASIAVPSFQSFFVSSRAQTQTANLIEAMNYARSEAVRRATEVRVRANSGTDWHTGWTVAVVNPATTLRVQPAFTGEATMTSAGDDVTFNNLGQVSDGATAAAPLTIRYCFASGHANQERIVVVSHAGHIRSGREVCP